MRVANMTTTRTKIGIRFLDSKESNYKQAC